jgi:hypothetical protein
MSLTQTLKLIKYEQALENYQLVLGKAKQQEALNEEKITFLGNHIEKLSHEHIEAMEQKDKEISSLRGELLRTL